MIAAAPYFVIFMMPAMLVMGIKLGGIWVLSPIVFAFGFIPLLDSLIAPNHHNPVATQSRWFFDVPLLLWIPTQIILTLYVLLCIYRQPLSNFEIATCIISLGIINGAGGITVAHELMHRKQAFYRALAELLMTAVSYPHFCIEHVLGHHRNIGTANDPATSRHGESFYRYYPRAVIGSFRSAWQLERERCRRKHIPALSLRNRRLRYALNLIIVYAGLTIVFGRMGPLLFLVQSIVAFSLLELINYIEHYGLLRKETSPGVYERVQPKHSWNSAHRVSNYYLFNLARHSDHHALASREYNLLQHHEEAPQMPAGYASMVILALFPPLWFRVMNRGN